MPETTDDPELLRRYAEERSEAAFAELVRRHLHFVHASALRRTGGEIQVAEAVCRLVFTWLARDAASLSGQPLLTGWLHAKTQAAVAEVARGERRRASREPARLAGAPAGEAIDWTRLQPAFDTALTQMSELDREALLLRVLRQCSWDVVGAKLSLSDSSVRMRVERALARFVAAASERGVAINAAAFEAAIARQVASPMPPSLIPQVTNAALEAAAASGSRAEGEGAKRVPVAYALAGGLVAVAAIGIALYEAAEARDARLELARLQQKLDGIGGETRLLNERLQAEARRAQAADEDNARLLEAVTSIAAAGPTPDSAGSSSTPDTVMARFRHAGDLARAGDLAPALQEYLWCYDEGMPRFASLFGLRGSVLARAIADLGRQYPPALQALRDRRARVEQRMLAAATDRDAAIELAELNDALGDGARTLAQFDKLAPNDPRRQSLGSRLRETLLQERRYEDLVQARTFAQMSTEFEALSTGLGTGQGLPAAAQQEMHDGVIRSTAADIEALAGAGDLAHARTLATRLLAYDGSAETRAQLQQRLTRAGRPDLLNGLARE